MTTADQDWLAAQSEHRAIWTPDHPAYPRRWRDLHKPPQTVWVQGIGVGGWASDDAWQGPSLAIVGSRNPTPQGLIHAREMARSLQQRGVCIVSGLALGIDGAAHEGALLATPHPAPFPALKTVAFVGTGVDRVYPRRHQDLAHRVAGQGALVSEYPLGSPAHAHHFPLRNRLIAASVDGVLVVEAALGSGSLITAFLALELGKEVFAVPGSIHSPLAKGCHALLRQGATLVESVNDVLEVLSPGLWTQLRPEPNLERAGDATGSAPSLSKEPLAGDEWGLRGLLQEPADLDALMQATGSAPHELLPVLMEGQLRGLVSELPGGRFVWVHPHLPSP